MRLMDLSLKELCEYLHSRPDLDDVAAIRAVTLMRNSTQAAQFARLALVSASSPCRNRTRLGRWLRGVGQNVVGLLLVLASNPKVRAPRLPPVARSSDLHLATRVWKKDIGNDMRRRLRTGSRDRGRGGGYRGLGRRRLLARRGGRHRLPRCGLVLILRFRPSRSGALRSDCPPASILVPLCGEDPELRERLLALCRQIYGAPVQLVCGVCDARRPGGRHRPVRRRRGGRGPDRSRKSTPGCTAATERSPIS